MLQDVATESWSSQTQSCKLIFFKLTNIF
jgi:hypothetical protein